MKALLVISMLILNIKYAHSLSAVHFGTYVPYFKSAQTSDSGNTKVFEITPYISYSMLIPLGTYSFIPEFGMTLLDQNTQAGYTKNYMLIRYMFAKPISPQFQIRYGLSTTWVRIEGDGGSVVRNNGNGTTTSYYPDETRYSHITTLDGGFEFNFKQIYTLRFDLQIMGFKDLENSNLNYVAGISRYFQ